MKKGCQSYYTDKKGVRKAFGTMSEAVQAVRADYGTELEAKASEYYREHRSKTQTEEGTQEDFDAYVEFVRNKANTGEIKSFVKPSETGKTTDNWKDEEPTDLDEDEASKLFEENDLLDFDSTPEERSQRADLLTRDDSLPTLMSPVRKKLYTEGAGEFLVIDTKTGSIYNSYKQSLVVASIFQSVVSGMEKGANATQAFALAKKIFEERRAQYYKHSKADVFDAASDKMKDIMAIKSIADADELASEYDMVIRNWSEFERHTKNSLRAILGIKENFKESGKVVESSAEDILDGYEELDTVLEKTSFDDAANFSIDHKDTASARLKAFLALQRAPEKSFLNLNTFIPFDTVYDELQMFLAGVAPSYEAMIKELTIHAAKKPYIARLITQLESKGQQLKNDFVVAFSKQHQRHVFTDFVAKKSGDKLSMQFRNMASDRNDIVKTIQKKWLENQKKSPMVTNKKGELVIDPKVAEEFSKRVDALAAVDVITMSDVQDLLRLTGIEISVAALSYFSNKSLKLTNTSFQGHFKKGGIFKYLADAFTKGDQDASQEDRLLDLNNPLTGNESTSMTILAKIEAEFTDAVFSNSWKNVEGKTIYSYGLNTKLSHQVRELLENNGKNETTTKLSQISFQSRSEWLRRIKEDKEFRDALGLFYLDGFKKQRSKKKGLTRGQQSTREMELQMLSLFQNQGSNKGYFIFPTISDKSTTPVLSALKHNSQIAIKADGSMLIGKNTQTGEDTAKSLLDIVYAEIDRIQNYNLPEKGEEYSAYDVRWNESTSKWEGGAINFYTFPSVNDIVEVVFDEATKKFVVVYDKDVLRKHVLNEVKELAKAKVEKWKSLGIIEAGKKSMLDLSYINKRVLKGNVENRTNEEHIALYAALDMEINYIISNANIMQLIGGDPATHFKKNVEVTLTEYTKRLAKEIAPGMDGAFQKSTYTVAYLEDLVAKSQHIEEYNKVLGLAVGEKNPYANLDVTDGQEYTTLQEHINIMYAYGKLNEADYNAINQKIKDKEDLNEEQLKIVLQPMKPVQTYTNMDVARDVAMPIYIKSSSYPLVPQLTKGLEIDKVRVQMEEHGIDRGVYKSAAKLGSTRISKIWDNTTEKTKDNLSLEGKKIILDRKGFRIQQEKPYDATKKKIVTITQMNKLLFEGILELPALNEGEMSMKDLRERKEAIRKKFFTSGLESWYKSIGVQMVTTTNSDGTFSYEPQIVDISKLQTALQKEAESKGYPINDIQALRLNKKGDAFEIPINMNTSAKKIESMLMSMVTNSAIKHKMPGKSYIQGSSAGFLTGATTGRSWDQLTQAEINSITFSEKFDPVTGLKYLREGEDGRTLGAQMIMPFFLKDKNGNRLNMKDYVKKVNGKLVIDHEKLPEDVLKLIGARIPNQGHSSMLPIEVVGFLPESMGDLMIVPKEITKQMGSDFDVDVLYTYQYNYDIDPTTKAITKVRHKKTASKTVPKKQSAKEIKSSDLSTFTNHSGGAKGYDAEWDVIGEEFGMVNNKHYLLPSDGTVSDPRLQAKGVKPVDATNDVGPVALQGPATGIAQIAVTNAERSMGRIDKTHTTRNTKKIRNYAQVKNADGVFAIGSLIPKGADIAVARGQAIKKALVPQVNGGTSVAVQLGITMGKPTYVFNQVANSTYPQGWYMWDNTKQDFVSINTPVLTKNFAGIGTSSNTTEAGKQAIRDVYQKSTQAKIPNKISEKEAKELETDLKQLLENIESMTAANADLNKIEEAKERVRNIISTLENAKITTVEKERPPITMGKIIFNDQQNDAYYAIKDWLETPSTAFVLEGYAGTGKTTIIKKMIEDLKSVAVSAPTHKAKEVIAKTTGKDDFTIQALLGLAPNFDIDKFDPTKVEFSPSRAPKIKGYKVLIVDEASMLNKNLYEFLLAEANKWGTKIIFMGDPAQIPPVGEKLSDVFTQTKDSAKLSKVERQAGDNPLGGIYDAIRSNIASEIDMFSHRSNINDKGEGIEFFELGRKDEFITSLLETFRKDPTDTKFITWTNESVKTYNELIRAALNPDATDHIAPKDVMMMYDTISNGESPIYTNSEELVVKSTKKEIVDGIEVFVTTFEGKPEGYPPLRVLNPTPENIAKYSDKLESLKNTALEIKRTTGKSYGWAKFFEFKNKLVSPVQINDKSGKLLATKAISYGYAITAHKSQGSTYNNVFVNEANMDRNRIASERNSLKYVALSRPRVKATVLTNKGPESPKGTPVKVPESIKESEQPIKENSAKYAFSELTQDAIANKDRFVEKEVPVEMIEVETTESLQNEYIDIHWNVLTDPRLLKKILAPLDKKGKYSIASEADIIHTIRSKRNKRVSPLGTDANISTYRQNKGGKDGVGVFSLASTFNSYIQGHNLRLGYIEMTNSGPSEVPIVLSMFKGFELQNLSDPGNNENGDKVSVISDMQSAAVDNAKEQTLDKINLNNVTFKAANAMAQLNDKKGKNLDITYITRFLSQKILLEFVEEVQNISDSTTEEFFPKPEIEAAARIKKRYEANIIGDVEENDEGHTPESLLALIEGEDMPNNAWYRDQIKVLDNFMELDALGLEISNVQSALNTESKGLMPSFFKVQDKVIKIQKVKNSPTLRGTESLISTRSELGMYATANAAAIQVYSSLLRQGSELSISTTEYVALILNKSDKFSADDKQKLFDDLKSFMLMRKGTIVADVDASRQRLLVDSESNQSLATRVKEAQETWGAKNFLLRRLSPNFSTVEGNPSSITYLASAGERVDESEATRAFIDMLGSEDGSIRKLGEDLVEYLYITGGNQSASNFFKFVPSIYLTIANYANRMSQTKWTADSTLSKNFAIQYLQHNPEVAPSMPKSVEGTIKNGRFVIPPVSETMQQETGKAPNELSRYVYTTFDIDGQVRHNYVEFMQMRDFDKNRFRLYMKSGESAQGVEYVEIDIAGDSGGISEYRGDGGVIKSDYATNKAKTVPKVPQQVVTNSGVKGGAVVNNPLNNSEGLANYGLKTTDTKEGVMRAVEKISKESLNPAFRALAKVLLANADNSDNFVFDVKYLQGAIGRYSSSQDPNTREVSGVLSLDMSFMVDANGNFDSNLFEYVILHELTHGQTAALIKVHENALKNGAPSPFSKEIQTAVNSINALRETLIRNLSEEDRENYYKFLAMNLTERIEVSGKGFSREQKKMYYSLTSTSEFVAQVMSSEMFQKQLAEIPFSGKKTILDRFLDLLSNLFKGIAHNLDVKVEDTALEEAIRSSLNLLQHTNSTREALDGDSNNEIVTAATFGTETKMATNEMAKEIRTFMNFVNPTSGMLAKDGTLRHYPLTDAGYNTIISKANQINTKNKEFKEKYGDKYMVKVSKNPKGYVLAVYEIIPVSSNDDIAFDQFLEGLIAQDVVDPAVQKIIDQLENRKKTLQRRSSGANVDKAMYQERINNIENQIERLREENSISEVGVVAKSQLDWASKMLDKKTLTEGELKDVTDLIDSWLAVRDIFSDDYSGKFGRILNDINNRAKELDNKRKKILLSHMLKLTSADTSQKILEADLKTMVDSNVLSSMFLDISRLNNPSVQALANWLHDAARNTNYEFTTIEQQISEAFAKLKDTAEYKNNKFDIFLQKGANGQWTGGLVTRYTQAYYDELIVQKQKRIRRGAKGWADYFKWRKENETLVDSRVLFDDNGDRISDHVAKKHIEELKDEFGDVRAEEMIQQAQDKYLEYLSDLNAFEISLQSEIEDKESEEYKARVRAWKIENSPNVYINSYKGAAIIKGAKLSGYKYTVSKPKKIGKDGKPTKWYDSSFEKIENTPALKEFYDFYRAAMDTMMKNLPTHEAEKHQANFIPFLQKSLIDKFAVGGVKAGLAGLYDNFVESLSDSDSVSVSSDRDVRTGQVNKRVPIRFLQQGDPSEKSTDLIKALELFTLMSLNYKHKTNVEDKALLMKRLISEAAEQQVTGTGEAQVDTKGKLFKINGNGALANTTAAVDHAINAALYGERRKKGTPVGIVFADKLADSREATKLTRQIKTLNKKHAAGLITDEEHAAQVEPLQTRLTAIGGKNLTDVDVADFMIKMTQLKGMAYNVFSATTNMTFGVITNFIHAAGKEDFTTGEARRAWSMMLASTSKSLGLDRAGIADKQAKKINNMIRKMDILFEVNESAYNGDTKSREKSSPFSKMSPYELQKRSEYFIQGQVMIAKMLHMKATTIDGKETSLWEAFDENGNWRVDQYGKDTGWEGDVNDNTQMKSFKKLRNHIIQLNKRLHGNYDPNSLPMIKKSAIGRILVQFRSWMAEGFASRFEGGSFDRQLDREIKGTYRSVYEVTMNEGVMSSLKKFAKIAMRSSNGLEGLSDVDKANFRKVLSEMTWAATLSLLGLMLANMAGDDDDEEFAVRNITLNQTYRLVSDLTFWNNPTSFNSIISNPVPIMRLFTDFGAAMSASYKMIAQEEDEDGRSKMTAEKMWLKWAKTIPFGSQIPKWVTNVDSVVY